MGMLAECPARRLCLSAEVSVGMTMLLVQGRRYCVTSAEVFTRRQLGHGGSVGVCGRDWAMYVLERTKLAKK